MSLELFNKIESAREKARARKSNQNSIPTETPGISKTLPLWSENVRAVPNSFLRTALFGVANERSYVKGELVAALSGTQIKYTGETLNQGDLDVLESIFHVVREQNLGTQCFVKGSTLLRLMGKTDCGKTRSVLHARITRLVAGAVEVKQGRYSYIGNLIKEAFIDEKSGMWVICLNPRLLSLFSFDQFTLIDWNVRKSLIGKPIAQWLHGFYSSHANPFPLKVETLSRLSGSGTRDIHKFSQLLRESLNDVVDACAKHDEIFKFELAGGKVYVERSRKH